MFTSRHVTAEGLEMTFALNHMAYFLLTRELLPLLEAAPAGRIVNVASGAHARANLDMTDLQYERRPYFFFGAYAQSKLLNILFTFELARRLKDKGAPVTANCVHPGFVRTGFGKNDAWWMKAAVSVGGLFGRSPRQGAEGIIHLATSPDVEGVSGEYFKDHDRSRCTRIARDPSIAKQLWDLSERLTGEVLARAA
jgi:NAD(P)-dependent dehydrogenase (short-subunit alcohol dehydrogenase family)